MLNNVVVVGRLLDKPEIEELENGKKVTNITLVVPRNFKNENGDRKSTRLNSSHAL